MAEDLEQTIRENAQGPKRAKGDSGEVQQDAYPPEPCPSGGPNEPRPDPGRPPVAGPSLRGDYAGA